MMGDITIEARRFLSEKTEVLLKEKIGHLDIKEIKKRCCCIVRGFVYTYYLDDIPILQTDYRLIVG